MVSSQAQTVDEYLAELSPARREAMIALREVVLRNLPDGYAECMQYGMIGYVVPLERHPVTYNGQPLAYAGIASQKNYMSIYLMGVYADAEASNWFHERYKISGKTLNMGKSCVRFKKPEDLPLDLIGETIARTPVDQFITRYETLHKR
ncbi:MAG: DUF1801 domain-containing protein [Chloroflexi bacterium]|nr:DUF1801 domain-containing protein [Chloroflexota bacterium]